MDYIINYEPIINENINYEYLKNIEEKITNKDDVTNEEISYLLDSICYISRMQVNSELDNFDYKCDLFQSILFYYFEKLNCEVIPCMTQNVITSNIVGHSFLVIKLLVNGTEDYYLLDPSYIQFFKTEKCQNSNYFINENKVILTPDPGYFIKDVNSAKYLLDHGHIILNEQTAKMYGDSFFNTKTGISANDINYKTIPGSIYINSFLKGNEKLSKSEEELYQLALLIEPISIETETYNRKIT